MEYRCRFTIIFVLYVVYVFASLLLFLSMSRFSPAWSWGMQWGRQSAGVTYQYQEVLVRYRPEASLTDINKSYNSLGLNEVSLSPYTGMRRVKVLSNTSAYVISANLNQNPLVTYAEPNYVRTVNFVPNDPLYKFQWHLDNPMMQQTWDLSLGANVVVAVFDTGIAHRNGGGYALAPDLADTPFVPGYDFVNDDPYPDDDNRHGTHIAGTIAQSTNNLLGGCGVAPGCILMPVKVLDQTGAGNVADIVDAIYFAVNNGAQIINMSYGFITSPSASEEEAINYAVSQGITVICSAGNEASSEPHYPSSYDATICVTATKYDHAFADSYSNYGPDTDVCAPGGELSEDLNGDRNPDGIYQQTHNGVDFQTFDFYFAEGTSCAAAFVSGIAALILARTGRPLTPLEVREILQSTATDLGAAGWDQYYGWGLVNPLAAVQAASAYTAASTFWPFTAARPAAYTTQVSLPARNASINQANASNERVTYQTNAGFITSSQAGIQAIPAVNAPFASSPNTIVGYPLTSRLPYQFTTAFAPLLIWQNLLTAPQQSYTSVSSGRYQTESTFASGIATRSPQSWGNFLFSPSFGVPAFSVPFSVSIYPFFPLYFR